MIFAQEDVRQARLFARAQPNKRSSHAAPYRRPFDRSLLPLVLADDVHLGKTEIRGENLSNFATFFLATLDITSFPMFGLYLHFAPGRPIRRVKHTLLRGFSSLMAKNVREFSCGGRYANDLPPSSLLQYFRGLNKNMHYEHDPECFAGKGFHV